MKGSGNKGRVGGKGLEIKCLALYYIIQAGVKK